MVNASMSQRLLAPDRFVAALRPELNQGETYAAAEVNLNWSGECEKHAVRHLPLHTDGAQPQVTCQVSGAKSWHLMPLEVSGEILSLEGLQDIEGAQEEPIMTQESSKTQWYSPFHPTWNQACFPQSQIPPPMVVKVEAGDCLMVPQNWWHATEARGRSVSLNVVVKQRWSESPLHVGHMKRYTPRRVAMPSALAEDAIKMWPLLDWDDAKETTGFGLSFARSPTPTPLPPAGAPVIPYSAGINAT